MDQYLVLTAEILERRLCHMLTAKVGPITRSLKVGRIEPTTPQFDVCAYPSIRLEQRFPPCGRGWIRPVLTNTASGIANQKVTALSRLVADLSPERELWPFVTRLLSPGAGGGEVTNFLTIRTLCNAVSRVARQ
ncbi:hypothetical protein RRG08_019453 [Elysia crispata]|uniref:Uncharacterized protein n=1 Tax=Elysia crispata TaxID=231223 RepID=A0AAE1CVJ8_9GAST|nr:hypothetical protein RRG08_019453 [Elysia crispata]